MPMLKMTSLRKTLMLMSLKMAKYRSKLASYMFWRQLNPLSAMKLWLLMPKAKCLLLTGLSMSILNSSMSSFSLELFVIDVRISVREEKGQLRPEGRNARGGTRLRGPENLGPLRGLENRPLVSAIRGLGGTQTQTFWPGYLRVGWGSSK